MSFRNSLDDVIGIEERVQAIVVKSGRLDLEESEGSSVELLKLTSMVLNSPAVQMTTTHALAIGFLSNDVQIFRKKPLHEEITLARLLDIL